MGNLRELSQSDMNDYLSNPDLSLSNQKLLEKITVPEMILQLNSCVDFPDEYDYESETESVSNLLIKTLDRFISDSTHAQEILLNEQSKELFFLACKSGFDCIRVLIAKKMKYFLDFKDPKDEIHSIAWEMLFDPYFSVHNHIAKMLLNLLYDNNKLLFTDENVEYLANFVKLDANPPDSLSEEDEDQIINYKLRIIDFAIDSSIISGEVYKKISEMDIFGEIFNYYKSNDVLIKLNCLQIAEKYILSRLDSKYLKINLSGECETIKLLFKELEVHANDYFNDGINVIMFPPLLEFIATLAECYRSFEILKINDYYILKLISDILTNFTTDVCNPVVFAAIHSFYSLYHIEEFNSTLDNYPDIASEMIKRLASINEQLQYESICTFIKLAESMKDCVNIFEKMFLKNVGPFILTNFSRFPLQETRTKIYNLLELMLVPQFKGFKIFFGHVVTFFRKLDFKLQDVSYATTLAKDNLIQGIIKVNSHESLDAKFNDHEIGKLRQLISNNF